MLRCPICLVPTWTVNTQLFVCMVCFVQMQRFHPVPALDRLHPLRTPVLNEEVTVFQIIPSSLTLHCARNRSCGSAIGVSSWRRGRFRKCMSGNAIEDIFLSERWGTCNMGDRWSNQNASGDRSRNRMSISTHAFQLYCQNLPPFGNFFIDIKTLFRLS